jgi:putative transposase
VFLLCSTTWKSNDNPGYLNYGIGERKLSLTYANQTLTRSGNCYNYEVKTICEPRKIRRKHNRDKWLRVRTSGMAANSTRPKGNQIQSGHLIACKHCHSVNIKKVGLYCEDQLYWCKDCKRKFADDGTLPKIKVPAEQIALAMGMYFGGMPLGSIQRLLDQHYGIRISELGIWYWVSRFSRDAIEKSLAFKPRVGKVWVVDETVVKLGNREVWFWDVIDLKTRYLLATQLLKKPTKAAYKALMNKAKKVAGKSPQKVLADKLKTYIEGTNTTFGSNTKRGKRGRFEVDSTSTGGIGCFYKTLRERTNVVRRFWNMGNGPLLTDAWLVYYNFLQGPTSLGNVSPARAMGDVPFHDWLDIVETARGGYDITFENYVVLRKNSHYRKHLTRKPKKPKMTQETCDIVRHIQSQILLP